MKSITLSLAILIAMLIIGCGRDIKQANLYSNMRSECDSLISQADIVISIQNAKIDSLRKIRIRMLKAKSQKLTDLDKRITSAVEIETNIDNVRKHLDIIKKFAEDGEKAASRRIFYKRKYVTYATTIQVHDENVMIQQITDGLSARQFISKYLPKDKR